LLAVLVLAIGLAVALLIPLVTRGSYSRLISVEWRWAPVLFTGLAVQIFLEIYTLPRDRWDDLGFGLLVLSYVLVLAFCARNLVVRGMGIVLIGIACNALVITVNQGMPVRMDDAWRDEPWAQATVKHHPEEPDDQLLFLSDIIVLDSPFNTVLSFGDLILAVGLCDVAYHASRKRRTRKRVAIDLTKEPAAAGFVLPGSDGGAGGSAHDPFERADDARVVYVPGS
jgi:hypothetical protein